VPITRTFTSTVDDRLDTLAGSLYGDARYWWVIAAASDIGWGLQIPPGTIIRVVDLVDVEEVL
jgi:nucleoid-associated protein YgaU